MTNQICTLCRSHPLSWSTITLSASYYLTAMFDNCIPWRQLGSCGVTRPFLSLRRVWLARLLKKSERASLILQVPGNKVRISGFIIFLGPHWENGDPLFPPPHNFIVSVTYPNLGLSLLEHVLQKWEEACSYIFQIQTGEQRFRIAEIHHNLYDGCYTDGLVLRGHIPFRKREGRGLVTFAAPACCTGIHLLTLRKC